MPSLQTQTMASMHADKEGVEVPHVLAAQLQRQMPATAHGAGVTALASHYHAKLSGNGTPSASACASSPSQRPADVHESDVPSDVRPAPLPHPECTAIVSSTSPSNACITIIHDAERWAAFVRVQAIVMPDV